MSIKDEGCVDSVVFELKAMNIYYRLLEKLFPSPVGKHWQNNHAT